MYLWVQSQCGHVGKLTGASGSLPELLPACMPWRKALGKQVAGKMASRFVWSCACQASLARTNRHLGELGGSKHPLLSCQQPGWCQWLGPAYLNETCTGSSAWHSLHLYPSFVLAGNSIFRANCRSSFKCHRKWNVSARQVMQKKGQVLIEATGDIFRWRSSLGLGSVGMEKHSHGLATSGKPPHSGLWLLVETRQQS